MSGEDWMYAYASGAEHWTVVGSREDTIAEGRDMFPGEPFVICRGRKIEPGDMSRPNIDGEGLWLSACDGAELPDDAHDRVSGAPTAEQIADLERRLHEVFREWAAPVLAAVPFWLCTGKEEDVEPEEEVAGEEVSGG